MKPTFLRLTTEPNEGFVFKAIRSDGFHCPWHVHPEYELILVLEGKGYRIVGDNMTSLGPGDMVLVGPRLPHIWQEESGAGKLVVQTLLIQFDEAFLGDGLMKLPAMEPVRQLLTNSARGLRIVGATRTRVSALMKAMIGSKGVERIIQFLQILSALANSKDCHPIASASFAVNPKPYDEERMARVFDLLTSRLGEGVRLQDAARLVHLSQGAFSRFFKAHTGKTFPEFLNELRIGRACQLLTETELNITEVAFDSGFSNLSNFNRQFLRLKAVSPRAFRRTMQARLPALSPHR